MKAKYVCTMSQAKKIIVAIWLASCILALPVLIVQVHIMDYTDSNQVTSRIYAVLLDVCVRV